MTTRIQQVFFGVGFLLVCYCLFLYFSELPAVPFHPDESTYLFMSEDFDSFFRNPRQIFQVDEYANPIKHRYRLIDAPLGNYWMGFWVYLGNEMPTQIDWDWSKSWVENLNRGALPGLDLLILGRISAAILFPISLVFAFLISKKTYGTYAAYTALFLACTNAIYLLHTRRAMHESISLMTIYVLLWFLPLAKTKPIQLGIASALALTAKQSALPIVLIALLLLFIPEKRPLNIAHEGKSSVLRAAKFAIPFLLIIFMLNPVYWNKPLQRFSESITVRQLLTQNQLTDFAWDPFPYSIPKTLVVILADIFFRPPSFAEVSNYSVDTAPSEAAYLSNSINTMFRGLIPGIIYLIITCFGIIVSLKTIRREGELGNFRVPIYLAAMFSQIAFNLIFLYLPWQRYVVPIMPYIILFASGGVHSILTIVLKKIAPV